MLEKDIEKLLVDEIKKLGGLCYKFLSPGNSGVPDRIVMLPGGKLVFVELKRGKSYKPTTLQRLQMRKIAQQGQEARVIVGLEGVEEFLKDCRKYMESESI